MKKGVVIGLGCGVVAVIVLGCVGLFGGLAWFGISTYKEMTGAADTFLAKISSNDISGAYHSGSTALKNAETESDFTKKVTSMGLTDYQSATYTKFDMNNDVGTLEGTMTTKKGASLPIKVTVAKENGEWKVSGIHATPVKEPPATIPAESDVQGMVRTALLDFNAGVKTEDFTAFYGTISELWQKQTTPKELKTAFQDFIDKKIDIDPIRKMEAVFTSDLTVDSDGVFTVTGEYPITPQKVLFELRYITEGGKWKLLGINIQTK